MEKVNVSKSAINDLIRLKEEFDSVIESLELINDDKFMSSYKKSKEQIKKRDFDNWDEL
ncbi:hypothetical protein HYT25_02895 [Candidatus Pacearchaeota archaeon]|nr:hypothetical protein [Candidatus Pacearchaeota archaeon]